MPFDGALFATYNLFTVGIGIYLSYLIVFGIKDLELLTGRQLAFQELFTIWKIQTICIWQNKSDPLLILMTLQK